MIEFDGIEELLKELASIEADTPKLKKEALIESADFFKEQVSKSVYSYGLNPVSGDAPKFIDRTNPKGDEIFVGNTSDGFYLYFQERGFWHVRKKEFVGPTPFMSVTYKKNRNAILDKQVEVLRKGLKIR